MSVEFFQKRILESMSLEGKTPDFSLYRFSDFIAAAASINNILDAQWFYEGALESEVESNGMEKFNECVDGVQKMILVSTNRISDAAERSERRAMWIDLFGTLDELIVQKEVICEY